MEYNNRRGTKGGPEDRYFSYINSLTAFSLGVLARGKSVKILIGEWCDRSAARDLHARLMATAPECADRIELCAANDIHDVVASVEQCDIVVATRFHNVVAALRMGRPVLSQGYASKNVRLMEEFGLSPYCQTIETCDVDRLLAQFDDLCANAGALAAPISAKASALHDAMNARLDQLADRIAAAVGAALAPRAAAPAASKPSGGAPRAPHPWAA